jgi:hypothetical protein
MNSLALIGDCHQDGAASVIASLACVRPRTGTAPQLDMAKDVRVGM